MDSEHILIVPEDARKEYNRWSQLLSESGYKMAREAVSYARMYRPVVNHNPERVFSQFVSEFSRVACYLWLLKPEISDLASQLYNPLTMEVHEAVLLACDVLSTNNNSPV